MRKSSARAPVDHAPIALLALLLAAAGASGQGFQNPDLSARAAGMGEAFFASSDDPTAIAYNPAGLVRLDGSALTLQAHAVWLNPRFESDAGIAGDGDADGFGLLPGVFFTTDAGTSRWRFGVAAYTAYGLAIDWGDSSPAPGSVTEAELGVLAVSPTIAFEIAPELAIAGSLNVYAGTIDRQSAPTLAPGVTGALDLDGDGTGLGGTLALLFRPDDAHSIGFVYRSPFRIGFDGQATIRGPDGATIERADADLTLDFPQTFTVGYAYTPDDAWHFETALQVVDWEGLDTVGLDSPSPTFAATPAEQFNYETAMSYRFGIQHRPNDRWTLRAGYGFFESIIPDSTLGPLVPIGDSHLLSAGVGYRTERFAIDAAYQFIVRPGNDANGSTNSPDGRYSDEAHGVLVSLTVAF